MLLGEHAVIGGVNGSSQPVDPVRPYISAGRSLAGEGAEEIVIEPNLPIIDTHHHLWQRPDHRYLLQELLDDLGRGHNLTATVFLQCHAMYRQGGPEEFRPVGETEFVTGVGAMSDSGGYGTIRVARASSGLPT